MRRVAVGLFFAVLLVALPASAQQERSINLLEPPPPPPEEPSLPDLLPLARYLPHNLAEGLPRVVGHALIPSGTRIDVVLATPLSTRITKTGDRVMFRTAQPVRLDQNLILPEETAFVGKVTHLKRPGAFGKRGSIRVAVAQLELGAGLAFELQARLASPDADATGRISADNDRAADLLDLAQWTLLGTMLGWDIDGGKGAAVGAAAGAAIALIIMGARRGPDVYLEPGMPFSIVLDGPVELPAAKLYALHHARTLQVLEESQVHGEAIRDAAAAGQDHHRPQLKRRPK